MEKQGFQDATAPPPYSGPGGDQQPGYPPVTSYAQTVTTTQGQDFSQQQYQYPQQPYAPQQYGQQYGQTTQSTVVVSQPGYAVGAPVAMVAPPNHMALAWMTCLFCFWPLGLAAIIKSNEVDNAMRVGDVNRATIASRSSRKLSLISIGLGIASYVVIVVVIILRVSLATRSYYSY